MNRKKNIMQENLPQENRESLDGELRPIRRRSSIVPRINSDPLEINDDSVERGQTRYASSPIAAIKSTSNSRRSINLGSLAQLTAPQLAEGIQECIKLNTENKITKKNAYSLRMIDFMTYMVKTRDEKMSDLQMASTSLDVSAKIYSLRVDVLHQATMDMAGNLHRQKENSYEAGHENGNKACEDMTESEHQNEGKSKKKKKKGAKVLVDLASLCCEPEIIKLEPSRLGDGDFHTSDMLVQVTAPRHVGLGLSIHAYSDCFLDQKEPDDEQNEKIPWNPINIPETKAMGKIFEEFDFLNWNEDYATADLQQTMMQKNTSIIDERMRFDLEASVHVDDDNNDDHDMYIDHVGIGENGMDEDGEAPMLMAAAGFGHGPHRRPKDIVNFDDLLSHASTADDYSFFDNKIPDIRWTAGNQWTVKKLSKQLQTSHLEAQRKGSVRKKKDLFLNFAEELNEEIEAKYTHMKKVKRKLKSCEDNINKPVETIEDKFELFKYSHRPNDIDFQPKKRNDNTTTQINREEIDIGDYNNFDDCMDESHVMDQDNDMPMSPNMFDNDEIAPSQGAFIGTNLVEAPKLTEKIYIPFSQRAKKLDMRHLKKCIWDSVNSTVDDKENVNDQAKLDANEPKQFLDIYSHLPEKLSKNDAKELSFPIAFVSLLHLANEKTLKLISTNDLTDVLVIQDSLG